VAARRLHRLLGRPVRGMPLWFEEQGVEMKIEACEYGHIQNFYVPVKKRLEERRCPVCGSPTLADCPKCGEAIGKRVGSGFAPIVWERDLRTPPHCPRCGTAMPWRRRRGRGAERLGTARSLVRRNVKFKASYAARVVSGFAAGLFVAMCVLAGRRTKATSSIKTLGDGQYRITVGSKKTFAVMELIMSRWVCDCPDFTGDAARCRHVWAVMLLDRLRPLARKLGAVGDLDRVAGEKTEAAAAIERSMKKASRSPETFEREALARIGSAWRRYLEWEYRSNQNMELSAEATEKDPELAMYHAQQAMETQIKAMWVYCSAFDDGFRPRDLNHDIFAWQLGEQFTKLLRSHQNELKEMTMGISASPTRSGIVKYLGNSPPLVAYGTDLDDDTALSNSPEKFTLEWYHSYLQRRLRPLWYRPSELKCPTHVYVSHEEYGRLSYDSGLETFTTQWTVDAGKLLADFLSGGWTWRYYALYVHETARYPSEFSNVYRQNVDAVRKWVFEAGFMTSSMQNDARMFYARHTHREGDARNRCVGVVRDHSWYRNQIWLLTGNEDWRVGGLPARLRHSGTGV